MVEEVEDYAILMLDADGHIMNWNRGAEKIKGYNEQEIIGRHFSCFYPAADRAAGLPEQLLQRAREEGKAIHEGWRVRKNGTRFWGSVVITALHGEENAIVGFSKVTRDLTERKLWEDNQQLYASRLEEQNRELQQFAHVAAHDMKEPLRKIQYYHSMLLGETLSPEKQRLLLQRSAEAAGRMQGLIEDLLAFTRVSQPVESFEQVDLEAIVTEVWEFYGETIERAQAELELGTLPGVRGIPFQLRQLFLNLLGNSIKYRSPHRPLRISVSAALSRGPVAPGVAVSAGPVTLAQPAEVQQYYKISVTDNGIGFPQEQAGRIFELFQRLHRRDQYPGTGIGLAICSKVMDCHKGYIIGRGIPDGGATFECYFPL
jgi:PAS domain S-box-containing protein